jgi:hypothetical protein
MKKTLLATAAAIAVMTTSASWAQRQDAPASGAQQPQRAPAAQQNAPAEKMAPSGQVAPSRANEGAASGNDRAQGTQVPPGQSRSTTGQSGAGGQMDRERSGPSGAQRQEGREGGADQPRTQQQQRGDGDRQTPRAQQDRPGQGNTAQDRDRPGAQDRDRPGQGTAQDRDRGRQNGNTAQDSDRQGGGTAAQGQRGGSGASVSLTTEQKTKIRSTVLTSNAPRVTNVDFSINVGTVVPRTVRVVAVPPTLIEIHPEWRGHMYFVHGDEIIVVEAGTMRIVAVLAV